MKSADLWKKEKKNNKTNSYGKVFLERLIKFLTSLLASISVYAC